MSDGSVSVPLALREISKMLDEGVSVYPVQRSPRRSTKELLSTHPENSAMSDGSVSIPLALREISKTFDKRVTIQRSPRCPTGVCLSPEPSERSQRCSTKECLRPEIPKVFDKRVTVYPSRDPQGVRQKSDYLPVH